jgi:hypothetical protein
MIYDYVQRVLFAMMSQFGTVAFGITTKAEKGGWYDNYVNEEASRATIEYIDFTTVCSACSILPSEQMMKCQHQPGGDVPWRDDEKVSINIQQ